MPQSRTRVLRGRLLDFLDDPADVGAASHRYHPDGLLVIEDGRITAAGDAATLLASLPGAAVDHYPGRLIRA